MGGCLPNIANIEMGPCDLSGLKIFKGAGFNNEIGAQLTSGSGLSAFHEGVSSSPQLPSRYAENDSKQSDDPLRVNPRISFAPRESRPFLPVFGLGAMTFLAGMFAGVYIDDRGARAVGWYRYLLRSAAVLEK